MRSYIFTESERALLETWLRTGEEDPTLRNLFSKMRRNLPQLRQDLNLMVKVAKKLRILNRWHGRMTASTKFGSALRNVGSGLTRRRKKGNRTQS